MPAGRPKVKLSDLPSNWKEKMLEMAGEGCSEVELRVEALDGICHELWERLIKEEPEFSETVKKCRQLCENWWVAKGRTNLENGQFNYTGWYMNMKNRFKWSDKQQIEEKSDTTLTIKWDA